jgi:C-terminal processing protease CtpA/Prc
MKQWMLICLLALSASAAAQTTQKAPSEKELAQAEVRREADEAKTRAKLEEARARLDKAAREVAELSTQLGANVRHNVRFIDGGPRKAVLGIQVDPDSGKDGVRVLSVSPGGPAAEAGLRDSDVITALDGVATTGGDSDRTLITQMRTVKPEQKVKVRVLREGKNKDFTVVARPMAFDERAFNVHMPDIAIARTMGAMPMVQHFRGFFPGDFGGLELASITPKLGAYFGVTEGVLVVQAPENEAIKLEDGDVLQAIDGRKPEDGGHALRILRSYKSGEKLNLTVLRQRKPVTLAITMPDRPEFGENFMFEGPPMPTAPMTAPRAGVSAAPPMPPMPASPGMRGPGTLEY